MNKNVKGKLRGSRLVKTNRGNRVMKKRKIEEPLEEVIQDSVDDSEEEKDESIIESENEVSSDSEKDDEGNVGSDSDENENTEVDSNEDESNDNESEEDKKDSDESKTKKINVSKRRRRKMKYNPVEEARLERLVFGDASDVIDNLSKHTIVKKKYEKSDDSDSDEKSIKSENDDFYAVDKNAPAWVDEDDMLCSVQAALHDQHRRLPKGRPEKVYTQFLKNKFEQIVGTPKWASLDSTERAENEDGDSDSESDTKRILKRSNFTVVSKLKKLRKGTIDIKALTDINKSTHTEGPFVNSLEFHPTSTVAMVAGSSGILSLFQVDGRENTKLQSISFEKFPIDCAKFLKEGTEVILGSRHHACGHSYDLMSGKTFKIPLPHGITNMQNFEVSPDGKFIAIVGKMGQIHLLSSTTKELVGNMKMNQKCLALAFSPDSDKLISHGESDHMYIWDLKSRSCVHKAIDDGCIASSAVTISPSGQFLATGSKQGVVNIYDTEQVYQSKNPVPLKIVLNLVTSIQRLKFNPTSEILGMISRFKDNAFKMVHIPSFTVFDNFPTFQTKMYKPLDIDFSPASGYLGLSNDKGHAYLYRLKHYGNY